MLKPILKRIPKHSSQDYMTYPLGRTEKQRHLKRRCYLSAIYTCKYRCAKKNLVRDFKYCVN